MSDMLGHDEPHLNEDGLCDCGCAECKGAFRHGKGLNVRVAPCLCKHCAHNTWSGVDGK